MAKNLAIHMQSMKRFNHINWLNRPFFLDKHKILVLNSKSHNPHYVSILMFKMDYIFFLRTQEINPRSFPKLSMTCQTQCLLSAPLIAALLRYEAGFLKTLSSRTVDG